MSSRIRSFVLPGAPVAALAASLAACATIGGARTSADVAAQGATYSCVLSTLRGGPLPVVRADSAHGVVLAQLREDVAPGSPRISGGAKGSASGAGDYESPYLIDVVAAQVKFDATAGRPVVEVRAMSGTGATAKGGYTVHAPSELAERTARAVRACGAA